MLTVILSGYHPYLTWSLIVVALFLFFGRLPSSRYLTIEDGWTYFLHGWTRVIAEVFQIEIPVRGSRFEELGRIAAAART